MHLAGSHVVYVATDFLGDLRRPGPFFRGESCSTEFCSAEQFQSEGVGPKTFESSRFFNVRFFNVKP